MNPTRVIFERIALWYGGMLIAVSLFLLYLDDALPLSMYLSLWSGINKGYAIWEYLPALLIGVFYVDAIVVTCVALFLRRRENLVSSSLPLVALLVLLLVVGAYMISLSLNHFCPLKCAFIYE